MQTLALDLRLEVVASPGGIEVDQLVDSVVSEPLVVARAGFENLTSPKRLRKTPLPHAATVGLCPLPRRLNSQSRAKDQRDFTRPTASSTMSNKEYRGA